MISKKIDCFFLSLCLFAHACSVRTKFFEPPHIDDADTLAVDQCGLFVFTCEGEASVAAFAKRVAAIVRQLMRRHEDLPPIMSSAEVLQFKEDEPSERETRVIFSNGASLARDFAQLRSVVERCRQLVVLVLGDARDVDASSVVQLRQCAALTSKNFRGVIVRAAVFDAIDVNQRDQVFCDVDCMSFEAALLHTFIFSTVPCPENN